MELARPRHFVTIITYRLLFLISTLGNFIRHKRDNNTHNIAYNFPRVNNVATVEYLFN